MVKRVAHSQKDTVGLGLLASFTTNSQSRLGLLEGWARWKLLWQKGCLALPRDWKALHPADDFRKDFFNSLHLRQGRVAPKREANERISGFFFHVHGAQDVGWFERSRRTGGATGSANPLQIQAGQQRNTVTPTNRERDCIAETLCKRPAENSAVAF